MTEQPRFEGNDQRTEALWALYDALLHRLLALLDATDSDLKASALDVARRFLHDNGVGLKRHPGGVRAGLRSMVDKQGRALVAPLPFDTDGKKSSH